MYERMEYDHDIDHNINVNDFRSFVKTSQQFLKSEFKVHNE